MAHWCRGGRRLPEGPQVPTLVANSSCVEVLHAVVGWSNWAKKDQLLEHRICDP